MRLCGEILKPFEILRGRVSIASSEKAAQILRRGKSKALRDFGYGEPLPKQENRLPKHALPGILSGRQIVSFFEDFYNVGLGVIKASGKITVLVYLNVVPVYMRFYFLRQPHLCRNDGFIKIGQQHICELLDINGVFILDIFPYERDCIRDKGILPHIYGNDGINFR